MTKGKNQHVTKRDEGWAVVGEGNSKATKITDTQKQAIDVARKIARNQESELIIHRKDNNHFRASDSHGHDPNPPKG